MILGRVHGSVVSTIKDAELQGHRLLLVQPLDLDGAPLGKDLVAVDTVGAGPGDRVLMFKEGGSARLLLKNPKVPLQLVIVAVVDSLEVADVEGAR